MCYNEKRAHPFHRRNERGPQRRTENHGFYSWEELGKLRNMLKETRVARKNEHETTQTNNKNQIQVLNTEHNLLQQHT